MKYWCYYTDVVRYLERLEANQSRKTAARHRFDVLQPTTQIARGAPENRISRRDIDLPPARHAPVKS